MTDPKTKNPETGTAGPDLKINNISERVTKYAFYAALVVATPGFLWGVWPGGNFGKMFGGSESAEQQSVNTDRPMAELTKAEEKMLNWLKENEPDKNKSNHLRLSTLGVQIKNEIDKLRELKKKTPPDQIQILEQESKIKQMFEEYKGAIK